ncbi:PE family protein [Nocardia sp. NEAU-G5]|uniref:PE family protein n=1 Tax=Nocardia albiluteola TaxID=2842303 RepID=A0ABS6B525_9NOCA|nr:PE family protein [Nocardia albiluteola]MBU3065404.1 PE family protein [Nocardia albiluteola]
MSKLAFDHELARQAAGRLDTLADRLEGSLRDAQISLRPAAAANDRVSLHTGQTFDQVGDSFQQSYRTGVHELRKIAANLRSHSDSFGDTDDQSVEAFRGLL